MSRMHTKQEKVDATILGIVFHPEVQPLSEECKEDIAIMVKTLADSLDPSLCEE